MGGGPHSENRHSPLTISMLEKALFVLLKERPHRGYPLLVDLGTLRLTIIHTSVVYRTLLDIVINLLFQLLFGNSNLLQEVYSFQYPDH
jgi:hypothetical protein